MKIPKTIKGSRDYTVRIVDAMPSNATGHTAEHGCLSQTDYKDYSIELLAGQKPEHMARSLLHEIVRMLAFDTGEIYLTEEEIAMLAGSLHRLIRDNPGLFDGLTEE